MLRKEVFGQKFLAGWIQYSLIVSKTWLESLREFVDVNIWSFLRKCYKRKTKKVIPRRLQFAKAALKILQTRFTNLKVITVMGVSEFSQTSDVTRTINRDNIAMFFQRRIFESMKEYEFSLLIHFNWMIWNWPISWGKCHFFKNLRL